MRHDLSQRCGFDFGRDFGRAKLGGVRPVSVPNNVGAVGEEPYLLACVPSWSP